MPHPLLATNPDNPRPVWLVTEESWPGLAADLPPQAGAFAAAQGFKGEAGRHCLLPDAGGGLLGAAFGLDGPGAGRPDPFLPGRLVALLPAGDYRFATPPPDPDLATLAWLLGGYAFTRYRAKPEPGPAALHVAKGDAFARCRATPERRVRLVPPAGADAAEAARIAHAVAFGRDLVNTPANDLGPDGIEAAARRIADRHGASFASIVGEDLLAQNLPLIHAVGRAAAVPPRLVEIAWGPADAPRVTVVGKGVAFDTGGLDIKPPASMLLMKKDMGGAAAALALADMIMGAGLRLRLRVLIPAVENAIAGNAFRPGDVLRSRKGITVEIGNTDAEGRLVLADALALADEEGPDLIVDFATLTGAARTALGPELPPFYTADEDLAAAIARWGGAVNDPVWRLPLWEPYRALLDSKVADLNNTGGPMAGSITAALFLSRFVTAARAWAHFDVYAWNPAAKPGRPEGGEVQGARLVYALAKERYGR